MSELDTYPRLRLIGGEMMAWSDQQHSPAGGAALHVFVNAFVGSDSRVLLAGPHTNELVEVLAEACGELTCLVRSHGDALALARRHSRHPRVRVLCGSLDKLASTEPHDVVLALGGLGRLSSPDGVQLSWEESLDRLIEAGSSTATVLLGVENPFGVHRLVDACPAAGHTDPAATGLLGHGLDRANPTGHAALVARLREAGLHVAPTYAGFATPYRPTVLVRSPELDAASGPTLVLAAEVAAAFTGSIGGADAPGANAIGGRPQLDEPRRLSGAALRAGLGVQLAPLWLVAAGRQPVRPHEPLPHAIVAGGPYASYWDSATAYHHGEDGQWTRRLLVDDRTDSGAGLRVVGRVGRTPALLTGPVTSARLLEELLLAACASHDLLAVRELVGGYARWLGDQQVADPASGAVAEPASGKAALPGALVFATPDNVTTDGTQHHLLDPSWHLSQPVPLEVALGRGLHRFAAGLLTAGLPHPWPAALDVESLTISLGAVAGQHITRETIHLAIALECEIQIAQRLLSPQLERELFGELSMISTRHTGLASRSYREMIITMDRLAEELAAAREEVAWWEARTERQERILRNRERDIRCIRRSASFKVGRALTAPLRLARRTVVKAARQGPNQ